ncbi:pentatricopeptide repeat-containing protein At5g61370, mitochondrial-like [Euphorbia lathyris]|uniref:pentatricopeptide repeat-containing protein At5g61370, mitochondrial-like n=1 Tax=Euphorbia lathyris TaxID=212925 RepID=UPI0033141F38
MGVSLQSSIDVLDPSVTEVFKPTREVEVKLQNLIRNNIPRTRARIGKTKGKFNKKMTSKKTKKKSLNHNWLFDLPFIRGKKICRYG